MSEYRLPKPGQYTDGLGRVMIDEQSTDGAWQASRDNTKTGRYAKQIVGHRTAQGCAHWDGALDGKAMRELMVLGVKEGLIVLGSDRKAKNIDRFLEVLRPFQLDIVKEGADELRALMAEAGVRREFFEVKLPGVWSDALANRQLREKLLGFVDPPLHYSDVTIQIAGEGQDGPTQYPDVTIQIAGEGQDGPHQGVTILPALPGLDERVTAFKAGLGPESQS